MNIERGDLWKYHDEGWWAVIPTNLSDDRGGKAIMGAGLAKDAKLKYPHIPEIYGYRLQQSIKGRLHLSHFPKERLIMLATKHVANKDSSLVLIERGLIQMREWLRQLDGSIPVKVAVPALGCGYGNLKWSQVKPLFEQSGIGTDDRTLIVVDQTFNLDE